MCYGSLIKLTIVENNITFQATSEGFTQDLLKLEKVSTVEKKNSYLDGLFKVYPPFYNEAYLNATKKYDEFLEKAVKENSSI